MTTSSSEKIQELLDRYTTYEPTTGEWTIYDNRGNVVKMTFSRVAAEAMAQAMYRQYLALTNR